MDNFTEKQQKMAFMGGAALLGAASALYVARKVFGGARVEEEVKCDLPTVYMPGIVSDIDGVVVKA